MFSDLGNIKIGGIAADIIAYLKKAFEMLKNLLAGSKGDE